MPGIGVIVNPRASGNRAHPEITSHLAAVVGADGEVVATPDLESLEQTLHRFHARGFKVLAVSGGDGSLCHAISGAVRVWGEDHLPEFVALRGGTINNVSRSIGGPVRPEAFLGKVMSGYRARREFVTSARPLLRVNGTIYGSIVGAGLITHFLEEYYEGSNPGPASAAAILVRCGISWLRGGKLIERIVPKIGGKAECDGEALPWNHYTLVLASSVKHIGLGVKPFYLSGRKQGYFHVLAGPATPGQLFSRLPRFRRGFPAGLDTLYDNIARSVRIEFDEPQSFTVDGELFPSVPVLSIEAGPAVRFVRG
ncbi:MAG TPA: diacylglycerol kinase family protein [Candidatus Limnocylindrales bacterium]|nr:diacylglycerol kinase family protein [Candidatus Limnocylindrales bacterium]